MAAPAFGSAGTYLAGVSGGSTSAAFAVPSGVAANDIILVFLYKENTNPVTKPDATWNEIATAPSTTAPQQHHAFWRRATAADTGTYGNFTWTGSAWREGVAIRITGAITSGSPIDVSNPNATNSNVTATPVVTVTTTGIDRLMVWSATNFNSGTWTAPTQGGGYTLRSTNGNDLIVATVAQAAAGTSGSVSGSCSSAARETAWLLAILPAFTVIGPITDSGTGDDSSVAIKPLFASTETGTGVDAPVIERQTAQTDSATGVDTPVVNILTPIGPATDSGTGTDGVSIFPFTPVVTTDSGVGADNPTVAITTFVPTTDTGTGLDTPTLLDQRAGVSDSATSAETATVVAVVTPTDAAIGVDDVTVVDIPFTQVLPAFRQGTVYDLVVMARVPQPTSAPSLLEVDPIEWSTLTWTNALSTAQELSVTCLIAGLTDPVITRLRDLATQPTELWLYRNGQIVFAGPIQTGSVAGETLTLNAKGLMTYLSNMFVTADLVFKAADQFQVVKGLVDHWQALDYGNYGIDTSHITNSGVTMDVNYLKTELHNIGQRIFDLGKTATGFDIEIDPITRQLQLWYPIKGVNRSVGEDSVVFDARNISSSNIMFSVTPTDVASEAFGTGTATSSDGTTYSTASNPDLRAKYGRSGVSGTFSGVPDQSTLDVFVQALVQARATALMVPGPEARDTPDADIGSYGVGDTILYQPNELLTISSAYRIRKQTVKVASTGQETLTLEFV